MNKIYSLKYCYKTHSLKVVSELARHVCKKGYRIKKLTQYLACFCILYSAYGNTAILSNDIPFQTYRDFAENKGMFAPGNKNIPIYDKNGNIKNILTIPVPDFSSISTLGIATLVDAQHIASVKHNGGYTNVSFGVGDNLYTIVNRNNNPSVDFHAPRLNKLVTEVAPMEVAKIDVGNKFDEKRYTQFI